MSTGKVFKHRTCAGGHRGALCRMTTLTRTKRQGTRAVARSRSLTYLGLRRQLAVVPLQRRDLIVQSQEGGAVRQTGFLRISELRLLELHVPVATGVSLTGWLASHAVDPFDGISEAHVLGTPR